MSYDEWKQTEPEYEDDTHYWDALDKIRDEILDNLTSLERAALDQDITLFKQFYDQDKANEYASNCSE